MAWTRNVVGTTVSTSWPPSTVVPSLSNDWLSLTCSLVTFLIRWWRNIFGIGGR